MDTLSTLTTQLALGNINSQPSVVLMVQKNKYKLYRVHLLHVLNEDDPEGKKPVLCDDPNFVSNVLFSDETTYLTTFVNRRNKCC